MKKIYTQKNIACGVVFLILSLPFFASAQVGIPCGEVVNGKLEECTFDHLIILINNIIKFLMFSVAVPLAALGLMWRGGVLVINQDKESAWSEAKEGFWDIGKGFMIMLGAYVLIKTILFAFLDEQYVQGSVLQFMFQ